MDVTAARLSNHRLLHDRFASATEAVGWLGAVQAQDYAGARWAIGQRTQGATDVVVDRLFDAGAIVRTHVLRPTWHAVLPADVRWLLELTGPSVRAGLRGRHRQLELSDGDIARAADLFGDALAGQRSLTRAELAEVLRSGGIATDGQRLPHLLLCAELDAVIISGPRRGTQLTWALVDDRVPRAGHLERDEALLQLACRYFRGHGPAQIRDFVWWSGLSVRDARRAIAAAGNGLTSLEIDGSQYWLAADAATSADLARDDVAHLLPNWDEYTVGYRDRSAAVLAGHAIDASRLPFGSILANVVIIDGWVRAGWTRTLGPGQVQVSVQPFSPLSAAEADAVQDAAQRFGRFLQRSANVVVVPSSL